MTTRPPATAPDFALTDLPGLLTAADGWDGLRAALATAQSGAIDGAWGSAAAVAAAAVARDAPGPVLVVVPAFADVATWAEDLAGFLGERPAVFPAHETWPPTTARGRITAETSDRLRTLQHLTADPPKVVLAPMAAVVQPVPPRADLAARGKTLTPAEVVDPDELSAWLVDRGYKRVEAVEYQGEFGRRGGILDVFPPDRPDPVRFEFFGDELESIRTFSAGTQRSLETLGKVTLLGLNDDDPKAQGPRSLGFLCDYFPDSSVVVLVEPSDLSEQGNHFFERVADATGLFTVHGAFAQLMQHPTVTVTAMPKSSVEATAHLRVESVERFSGNVQRVRDELDAIADTDRVLIACQSEAEVHRLTDVLKAGRLAESNRLKLVTGHVRAGLPAGRHRGRGPRQSRTVPQGLAPAGREGRPDRGHVPPRRRPGDRQLPRPRRRRLRRPRRPRPGPVPWDEDVVEAVDWATVTRPVTKTARCFPPWTMCNRPWTPRRRT